MSFLGNEYLKKLLSNPFMKELSSSSVTLYIEFMLTACHVAHITLLGILGISLVLTQNDCSLSSMLSLLINNYIA